MKKKLGEEAPRAALWTVLSLTALACAWGGGEREAGAAGAASEEGPVARVEDRVIEHEELLASAEEQLEAVEMERLQCQAQADQSRHQVLAAGLEELVRDDLAELAAAEAGVAKEEYLAGELEERRAAVDEAEVDRLIASNSRLSRMPKEQIGPQVRDYLAGNALFAELESRFEVERRLEPYRAPVDAAEGIAKGGEDAEVEIVEFSDFQCPYCRQVNPALEEVVDKYDGRVRLVFRQFPLTSIHPEAFKAAEASLCAADQGKFWEMHDLLFAEQGQLGVDQLEDKAERLGLDTEEFSQCLSSGRHEKQVRADMRAGVIAGVSGTPALFINGRPYQGERSVAAMSQVIDEELEAAD